MSSENQSKLHQIRHSAEHVLTQAMQHLYPNRFIMAMGPATDDGFYFDFESVDDFKIILPSIDILVGNFHLYIFDMKFPPVLKKIIPSFSF